MDKLGQDPAFPFSFTTISAFGTEQHDFYSGINKRFYAACMAMQGMLAHSTRYHPRQEDSYLHWHQAIAKEAFELADALVEQEDK